MGSRSRGRLVTTQPPPPESASPAIADGLAAEVTAVYVAAEAAILATITLSVRAALRASVPGNALQGRSAQVLTGVRRIMDRAESRARRLVPQALSDAYRRGGGIDRPGIADATQTVLGRLGTLRSAVLQWAARLWNQLTSAGYAPNPRPLIDRTLQREAGRGITAFDAGRRWHVPYRVEQVVAHQAGTASMDGWMQAVREQASDYVIVNRSPTACEICRPWVGRILSISGIDPDRPSVAEARRSGLWHPNCVHPALIWRLGFKWPDWAGVGHGGTPADYVATQRARQIERIIAHWQRRLAVALDDVTAALAKRKVRQWRVALADHRRTYGLSA